MTYEPEEPLTRTKPPTHYERQHAVLWPPSKALDDALDDALASRDREIGRLGNAVGALRQAIEHRDQIRQEVARHEAKASRLRRALEALTEDAAPEEAATP